jgi:hypothetical protein
LSRPLDIVQAVSNLKAVLEILSRIEAKIIGPSSYAAYLIKVLQKQGGDVTIYNNLCAKPPTPTTQDGIAIIGMAEKGLGSDNLKEF